ncbi:MULTISPECIES: helix-turn-helix domain-containing protein [Streptomyces]|uniref:helix-turn-helix domain-containing protein n=1 Tax=Streptomyces TaxID=1883 RepID=UPI000D0AAB09|nr:MULTISPECIES: helix-turn-helix domain-containing protein [Streptomyces]MYW60888.1 XRE family transcriptional regulator [Streptomyces sp. SID8370]MYW85044.1 XRE family transcriptional regulator [Streptomyces sp. SID8371]RZD56298.1 XRE family transcriptional regulator [Streptomyces albidoflavus]
MTEPQRNETSSLAGKLNHLFATVVPAGRGPYSTEEVARFITDDGVPISGSYIWLLRKGQRDNPTLRHIAALSAFFGVPPAYFFDDDVTTHVDSRLKLATALRDRHVRRLALRVSGLSTATLEALLTLVNEVRRLHNLPPDEQLPGLAGGADRGAPRE